MSRANNQKSDFAQRLPKHSPGKDLWPVIEQNLSAAPASLANRLPKHKPAGDLWPAISSKLPVPWYALHSVFMRSVLAGVAFILIVFVWKSGVRDRAKLMEMQQNVAEGKTQKDRYITYEATHEFAGISSEKQKTENIPPIQTEPEAVNPVNDVVNKAEDVAQLTEKSIGGNADKGAPESTNTGGTEDAENLYGLISEGVGISSEALALKSLPELNPLTFFDRVDSYSDPKNAPKHQANSAAKLSYAKEVDFEAGIFFRPSMIRDISTIHDDWVYSQGFGASIGMVQNRFLLETGVSLSRVEFEDKIEVDYFAIVFLGTVITPSQHTEEYVNEQGDTLTQVIYSVDVIDVYDSLFVEEEKNDLVKLSTTTIPLTVGYRIYDQGTKYLDLKTGLDMMIVTGRVIPGNPEQEGIRVTDVRNSLAGKYTLKWKYHLSLGAGLRITERMAIYAEPSLWWYPDGIRNGETLEIKHPFEAGLKLGLKWTF